jgi:hypothetical protein
MDSVVFTKESEVSEEFGVTVTLTTTAKMFVAPVVTRREKGKDDTVLVLVPEREGSQMRVGVPIEDYVAEKEASLLQIIETDGPASVGIFSREEKKANAEFYSDNDIPEWLVDVSSDMLGSLGMNVSDAIAQRQRSGIREANAEARAEISRKERSVGDMLREAGISGFKPSDGPAVDFDSMDAVAAMTEEEIDGLESAADELDQVVEQMRAKLRVEKARRAVGGRGVSDMPTVSEALALLRAIGAIGIV